MHEGVDAAGPRMSALVVRPPSLRTSVSSAPRAAIWSRFSRLKAFEVTMRMRYPSAAQTIASEAPVLPLVHSTTVPPRFSRPLSSPQRITARAIRSSMLPVGFSHSSFTSTSAHPGGTTFRRRTMEVPPMASSTPPPAPVGSPSGALLPHRGTSRRETSTVPPG